MTDRLTPGVLRDLADIWASPSPISKSFGDVLREEAARREAEAKPEYVTSALTGAVTLREGPGSADAPQWVRDAKFPSGGYIHKPDAQG